MEEKAEQVGVVMRPPRMSNKHVVLAGQAAEAEQQFAIARLHPGILL